MSTFFGPIHAQQTSLPVVANGGVGATWDVGIAAFDAGINFESCVNDFGAGCPNVDWRWSPGDDGYDVLELDYPGTGELAGVYFKASAPRDLSTFSGGTIEFDVRASVPGTALTIKVDCVYPCGSGDGFTAGFIHMLLEDQPLTAACGLGNALGAMVARQDGATRPISYQDVMAFMGTNQPEIMDDGFAEFLQ